MVKVSILSCASRPTLTPETWSSLEDYVGRMKPEQKEIYFIVGDDPKSVLRSPHLDYFQGRARKSFC